jgi:hypothetical protein
MPTFADEIGNFLGNHARFATARARQHQQRAVDIAHGFALAGVKVGQGTHGLDIKARDKPEYGCVFYQLGSTGGCAFMMHALRVLPIRRTTMRFAFHATMCSVDDYIPQAKAAEEFRLPRLHLP